MLNLKQKTATNTEPKRRSLFATLFIPNIGADIRPLQQITQNFVSLVAMMFAMNGLFPREHPALNGDDTAKLSLHQIIRTGWQRLSITQENLPQVLFFFGALGCIFIPVLIIFFGMLSLFVGKAHAQANFFIAPNPGGNTPGATTDLAIQILDYLFQAVPMNSAMIASPGVSNTILTANIIQCGFYTALGFYSDAILLIAAMVLFYHLAWMTVETAHHGVVMGQRGNQVWAPIRLVFAVGILVPTGGGGPAGCPGAGLSSGQILTIAIATWGSAMASNAWQVFANQMAADAFQYVPPPIGAVRKLVDDMVTNYACMYAFNWQLYDNYGGSARTAGSPPALDTSFPGMGAILEVEDPDKANSLSAAPASPAAHPWYTTLANQADKYVLTNKTVQDFDLCGSYIVPQPPNASDASFINQNGYGQGVVNAIYNAHIADFHTYQSFFQGAGSVAVAYFIDSHPLYQTEPNPPNALTDIDSPAGMVAKYQQKLMTDVTNAVIAAGNDGAMGIDLGTFTDGGWISAGAWFNRIAKVQADIFHAGMDALPTSAPPNLDGAASLNKYFAAHGDTSNVGDFALTISIYKKVQSELVAMKEYYAYFADQGVPLVGTTLAQQMQTAAREAASSQADPCLGGTGGVFGSGLHPTDCIFWTIDHLATKNGIWHAVPTGGGTQENLLGVQFTGANPLAEVAAFGQANVVTAYEMFDYGLLGSLAGGGLTGYAGGNNSREGADAKIAYYGQLISGMGSMMLTIGTVFFTIGFLMAFYVPLIPFITFFFGTLTWVAAVLEAVIAVPLIALAHLNPEGDGLPGRTAMQAYYFLFQVFLRPILMVFGLLCGFLIFYISVTLLNSLFSVAVAGTGGLNHGHFTAARIIYTAIYVLLVISTATTSFQLIGRLPDTAMQWLGGNGLPGADMGSAAKLEELTGGVQGYMMGRGVSGVGEAVGLGGQTGGALGRLGVDGLGLGGRIGGIHAPGGGPPPGGGGGGTRP